MAEINFGDSGSPCRLSRPLFISNYLPTDSNWFLDLFTICLDGFNDICICYWYSLLYEKIPYEFMAQSVECLCVINKRYVQSFIVFFIFFNGLFDSVDEIYGCEPFPKPFLMINLIYFCK